MCACQKKESTSPSAESSPATGRLPTRAVTVAPEKNHGGEPAPTYPTEVASDTKIYIDSVPQGATVSLLPREKEKGEREELGKTPLAVHSSQTHGMRLLIMMNMDNFLKQVEPIPELKDWVAGFKSDRYFASGPGGMDQNYFNFDTADSMSVQSANGGLVAVGPIYDLSSEIGPGSSRRSIRICALFIPRGVKREAFYPLMPRPGTFPELMGSWPDDFRSEYHLSDEQAHTALESLTRCGKYVVTIKDPYREGRGKQLSFTETADGMISITTTEIRLIPGYNDWP